MAEDPFVGVALEVARTILRPPFLVRRGAALFYELTLDNELQLTVNPRAPTRGQAAFQTDLCVFEQRERVELPRVVLEFKTRLTTHDILTYSAKARRHKQVYPYLRYGFVLSGVKVVPRRFHRHNEALDFALALADLEREQIHTELGELFEKEISASRLLEDLSFSKSGARLYRSEPTRK